MSGIYSVCAHQMIHHCRIIPHQRLSRCILTSLIHRLKKYERHTAPYLRSAQNEQFVLKKNQWKKSTENSNNTDAYDDFSPTSALTNQHISKKPPPPLIHLVQTATSAVPLCMNNGAHSARRVGKTKQKLNMSSADPRRPGWSCCQASLSI